MKPDSVISLFQVQRPKVWLLIFGCVLYFCFCWVIYSVAVEPLYGSLNPPGIAADSLAYFEIAGLGPSDSPPSDGALVAIGGSPLGPVAVALVGRNEAGVACVNCLLFLLSVWWAGMIPGVRREIFVLLLALNLQTLPSLMTLNKEILALTGVVAFAAYLYPSRPSVRRHGPLVLLFVGLVFSVLARWEQVLILLWYLAIQSDWSPVRRKPRMAVVALLLFCSAGFAAAVHILHVNLAGFLSQIEGGGTIVRLYTIQQNGGYFLVAFPKILMNLAGRFVSPGYFLHDYWAEFAGSTDWQNRYIGILASVAMLTIIAVALLRNRFRLSRPLIHLAVVYFICTAINPFIQPRYMYPGYVLIALELSRRAKYLEPAPPLPAPPALPASYLAPTASDDSRAGLGAY